MEEIQENEAQPKPECLNCGKKMPRKATFCPNCGQRNNKGKVSMSELLRRFWSNFSHLDGKFVKMCWQLLIPGKVTAEYFAGRQKRYPHPVQFFFVVMFFFLLFFSKAISEKEGNGIHFSKGNQNGINIDTTESQHRQQIKSEINFFDLLKQYMLEQKIRHSYDSLPAQWKTPVTRLALDSVATLINNPWKEELTTFREASADSTSTSDIDTIPLNMINRQFRFAVQDIVELTPDELCERYDIHDWKDQILIEQSIKSLKDSQSLIRTYTGNMAWTVLLLITLMSFILYLLYIRQKRYYVEHFVFLMHQNAGAFLLLTVALIIRRMAPDYVGASVWVLLVLCIGITLLFAMKRFYRQGWIKTIAKWLIYCILYCISFLIIFVLSLIAAFLIF
ncbi:MAG: DUF3667 domain-containing protein [Bacteroidetes bacterium]|nr:DUF3667 domain-containing protein [Bacteroidota bacterium]